jgi:hypothetical protein
MVFLRLDLRPSTVDLSLHGMCIGMDLRSCEANTMLFLWLVIFGGFDSEAGLSVYKTLS